MLPDQEEGGGALSESKTGCILGEFCMGQSKGSWRLALSLPLLGCYRGHLEYPFVRHCPIF